MHTYVTKRYMYTYKQYVQLTPFLYAFLTSCIEAYMHTYVTKRNIHEQKQDVQLAYFLYAFLTSCIEASSATWSNAHALSRVMRGALAILACSLCHLKVCLCVYVYVCMCTHMHYLELCGGALAILACSLCHLKVCMCVYVYVCMLHSQDLGYKHTHIPHIHTNINAQ